MSSCQLYSYQSVLFKGASIEKLNVIFMELYYNLALTKFHYTGSSVKGNFS